MYRVGLRSLYFYSHVAIDANRSTRGFRIHQRHREARADSRLPLLCTYSVRAAKADRLVGLTHETACGLSRTAGFRGLSD